MSIDSTIDILENEKECVKRANHCDRDCCKCDLLKEDYIILDAYNTALDWLRMIKIHKEYSDGILG